MGAAKEKAKKPFRASCAYDDVCLSTETIVFCVASKKRLHRDHCERCQAYVASKGNA